MEQQLITMTQKELSRYETIQNLIDGRKSIPIQNDTEIIQIALIMRKLTRYWYSLPPSTFWAYAQKVDAVND